MNRFLHKMALWGGIILTFALIGWGVVKLSSNTGLPNGSGVLSVPVNEQDNSIGPTDAPVTLVEYSDFQCPACSLFAPLVDKLLTEPELSGKLHVVYRYFPLSNIHANARLSAGAAQSAALQGKFWEMHDLLFKNQTMWAGQSTIDARGTFLGYAKQLKLDITKFTADIDSSAVRARVQADYDSAISSGISATPSFFVNGFAMPHPSSYNEFKGYLIKALSTQ